MADFQIADGWGDVATISKGSHHLYIGTARKGSRYTERSVVLTPKAARKFAKRLKRYARELEGRNRG